MSEAHKYLYDLDVECLSEDEIKRVDKLFDLGVKKGYIDNSFEEELAKSENPDAVVAAEEPEKAAELEKPVEDRNVPIPCWTVLYSATKNGETKCGECYSNAISVSAAKADCLAKLERFGYANVSILAIEAGDPDCAKNDIGCKPKYGAEDLNEEKENVEEDDMLKNRIHNLHKSNKLNEDDDTGDDAGDEGEDNAGDDTGSDDTGDDTGSDDAGDDTGSDDTGSDDTGDEGGDDAGDDAGSDESGDDTGSDDESRDDTGDDTGSDDENKELSDEEKSALKDEYKSTFREVMIQCNFEGRSFIDLTIPEKVQFFSALNVKWKKNDPKDFMSEDEQDQLESIVVNPQ